jgi:hypothetical protein
MKRLWHALFGYRLVVPDDVIAHHAARAGVRFEVMRGAFKVHHPEMQRVYAALTAIEREMDAVRTGR